ncbi:MULTISPECIES: hypothetical protein [Pseudomonas]|uniref:hypothetical protein n=1 Tax=Pseudomonas TaxID=286 RepID=UPI0012E2D8FD|nr:MULTISPECIES: hypothetical protein [Pseudomonas]
MLIDSDGTLTKDEALDSLRAAAESATNSLPDAFQKCSTDDERKAVMRHRDAIVLAHLRALDKSLQYNSKPFEDLAKALSDHAEKLGLQVSKTKDGTEAILLFSELLQLAATLALAFA